MIIFSRKRMVPGCCPSHRWMGIEIHLAHMPIQIVEQKYILSPSVLLLWSTACGRPIRQTGRITAARPPVLCCVLVELCSHPDGNALGVEPERAGACRGSVTARDKTTKKHADSLSRDLSDRLATGSRLPTQATSEKIAAVPKHLTPLITMPRSVFRRLTLTSFFTTGRAGPPDVHSFLSIPTLIFTTLPPVSLPGCSSPPPPLATPPYVPRLAGFSVFFFFRFRSFVLPWGPDERQ